MPARTIDLSPEDLASVQRLLANLTDVNSSGEGANGARVPLIKIARACFAIRKRRFDYFHRAMLGEPAYDMLLALYVAEADEQVVTASRLAEVADVAQSSAVRWIEYLVAKQLITREPHPTHKRASVLKLSSCGRKALEGVFAAFLEGMRDLSA